MPAATFKRNHLNSRRYWQFLRNGRNPALCLSLILIVFSLPAFGLLGGCAGGNQEPLNQQSVLNVGMILASGGLGDKSFNDSAYKGLLEAQRKFNIRFETVKFGTKEENLNALRSFAHNNYDLIIGVAFENMENIQTVAREFPQIRFAEIDAELSGDNIASIVYREQEADFLIGVLAAKITKTKYVGAIGGTDIPAIRRIFAGFKQGVSYQDNSIRIFSDFAGTFSDPQVGLTLALTRYGEGADVIHNAASKTGLGIIQAAQQMNKWTTGTSGDQRNLAPGNMIGNRPKRVDTAVQVIIEEVHNGTFKSGIRSLGLKENGLMLGPFDETVVTPEVTNRLEELKRQIISGEISVKGE